MHFPLQQGKSKEHDVHQKKSQMQRQIATRRLLREPMIMPPSNDMPYLHEYLIQSYYFQKAGNTVQKENVLFCYLKRERQENIQRE